MQGGEAGGITQQIGATYFSDEEFEGGYEQAQQRSANGVQRCRGLLVIDTPGHESFTNLRSRGSSLCDVAILVIDIMHGLEAQTVESLELLRSRKTPFIVALNKVIGSTGGKCAKIRPYARPSRSRKDFVIQEFDSRCKNVVTQLMEKGLNASLYYDNDDYKHVVSLVPTSAHSGRHS